MSRNVVVVAPHPDDETLGCGGTLMRHQANGDAIHWLIITAISVQEGFSAERVTKRSQEIEAVREKYGFQSMERLTFATTKLDEVPMAELVAAIGGYFAAVQPRIVYLPFRGDVHTDHRAVFDATISCTKWFRYPSIERFLAYETLSETEFGANIDTGGFRPNVFVNISPYIDRKIEIMKLYESEMGQFPFPRSEQAIRALAQLRGATCGYESAEAFMLLKEIWS